MEGNKLLILSAIAAFTILGPSSGCPENCKCSTEIDDYVVNCANLSLTSLPMDIPLDVTNLILTNNKFNNLSNSLSQFYNLSQLHLGFNHLRSLDLSALDNMPKLQQLSLNSNQITNIQTKIFKNISALQVLDVSENRITELDNKSFGNLGNLLFLNLSGNPVNQIANETFLSLTQLSTLDLSNLPVLNSEEVSISGLPSLRQLYLHNASISNISYLPFVFHSITSLHLLDLSDNNIEDIRGDTFPPLPVLETLYLDRNYISFIDEDFFVCMPSLQSLSLNSNNFETFTRPIFQSLTHLRDLSVSHMPSLYFLGKQTFSGLKNLVSLNICDNHRLTFIHNKLFNDLVNLQYLNLSFNNISSIQDLTFQSSRNLSIDLHGNQLSCDCHIDWLIKEIQGNNTSGNIHMLNKQNLMCTTANGTEILLHSHDASDITCGSVHINEDIDTQVSHKLGSCVRLFCRGVGSPVPKLTWITPRGERLTYHPVHDLMLWDYPSEEDVSENGTYHKDHYWHHSTGYYPELQKRPDRIFLLNDGSLYIDYVLRTDAGPYVCQVENPRNMTSVEIMFTLDNKVLMEVKIMSLFVGLGCAASFFMLNLIYAFTTALARRCINQRRREAILQFMENLDQYRSAKLGTLKDNYNSQVAKIRETYHNKMGALRENYNTQMNRLKEGASQIKEGTSHRVDIIRDKYHYQQKRLRDYSSHQIQQLREGYNNQILKARDYSSMRWGKIHKKYKLKQKHMMKILDAMNIDNCRTVLDAECVRTESMLLDSGDMIPHSPAESRSMSSDDYATAASSPGGSCEDLHDNNRDPQQATGAVSHGNTNELVCICDETNVTNASRQYLQHSLGVSETFVDIQMIDISDDDSGDDSDVCDNNDSTQV